MTGIDAGGRCRGESQRQWNAFMGYLLVAKILKPGHSQKRRSQKLRPALLFMIGRRVRGLFRSVVKVISTPDDVVRCRIVLAKLLAWAPKSVSLI